MIQALQLQKVDKNPGVLPVREGTALVSYDKWTVIKTLNIKSISDELELNIQRYSQLNNLVSICSQVPTIRQKRGIINPLGSLIKVITGNLDHDDAIKYDKLIQEVKFRQHSIEKKTTLLSEMIKVITNATVNVTDDIDKLNFAINRINNDMSINSYENEIIHLYNLFLHNFLIIYTKLTEIENVLAFSKTGVLHKSVIKSNELFNILERIEKTDKLVFKVTPENIIKIEQSITLKSYYKNHDINLVLEIPLVERNTYFYYKIVPLPITQPETNLTLIILPKYPYLIVKGLKAKSLMSACKNIDDNTYLCDELQTVVPVEDTCMLDLMRYSHEASCEQIPIELEKVKISPLQINRWMIYTKSPVELTRTCANEILHYNILGTYLLTIDDECQYDIEEHHLARRQSEGDQIIFPKLPLVNLPENLKIPQYKSVNPVKLSGVDLTDLKMLSFALKNSEINSDSIIRINSVSVWTIILYVLVILSFPMFFLFKNLFKKCKKGRNHFHKKSVKDDFELKEGGVTSSHRIETAVSTSDLRAE